MFKFSQYNHFDILIIFTLGLLAFGGYGGSLQPVRVFSILLIPYTLFELKKTRDGKYL